MIVATRPRYLNQQMDRWLRDNYFPGLSVSQLSGDFVDKFIPKHQPQGSRGFAPGGTSWMRCPSTVERILANRLSDLGLRRRM